MTISFSTDVDCDVVGDEDKARDEFLSAGPPVGVIHLGTESRDLHQVIEESEPPKQYFARYENRHMVYESPYFHHITIDGLEPDTTYFYRVFSEQRRADTRDEGGGYLRSRRRLNRLHYFRTAPRAEDQERPVSFAVFGDVGIRNQTVTSMKILESNKATFDSIILVGDIAYSRLNHDKWDTLFDYWDGYSVISSTPMQVAAGNHDIDRHPTTGDMFVAFDHRFRMPEVEPVEKEPDETMHERFADQPIPYPLAYDYGNAYYSYTYGMVRSIFLSSYSSMEGESKQLIWLKQELESIDRTKTPWICVTIHVPFYNSFDDHQYDVQTQVERSILEPLFVEHKVNVVFSGHNHAYLRTHPVANGVPNRDGPMHFTTGSFFRQKGDYLSEVPEEWVAYRDIHHYGYGKITFHNQTHAEWQWSGYREGQTDLAVNDTVTILNQFYL
jgi:predicted phosphodiesterase